MLSNDDLLVQAKKDIEGSWRHQSKWRDLARKSYKFEAGDQWEAADKDRLQKTLKRAAFTFNRIKPMVNAIVGMEIGNRQEVKCTPRDPSANGIAGIFDLVVAQVRDTSGMAREETDAWRDAIICGMGWTETSMDYSNGITGQIMVTRLSPLQMLWDRDAAQQNLEDATFRGYVRTYTKAQFSRKFPNFDPEMAKGAVFGVTTFDGLMDQPHNNDPDSRYSQKVQSPSKNATIAVVKYEYCQYEPMFYVANPMNPGQLEPYNEEDFNKIRAGLEAEGWAFYERGVAGPPEGAKQTVPYIRLEHRQWYCAYFTGDQVIEHVVSPDPKNGVLHCITGAREEETGFFFGVVEGAKDPQMLMNKIISSMVDLFNFGAKGGLTAEESAFSNPQQAQEDYARFDRILFVQDGKLGATRERNPAQMPTSADKIVELAINGLAATTGINYETIGTANKDQPGILEQTRKQSAMATMSAYFDSLRQYRINAARTLLYFIQTYMEAKTIARICGENADPTALMMLKDLDVTTLDIVVGDAPNNPNQRDAVLKVLIDMIQYSPEMAQIVAPEMVSYLPLPEPLIQKMQARIQASNQPDPMVEMAKQVALKKAMAEVQELLARADSELAKAGAATGGTAIKELKAQLDFIEAMVGHAVSANKQETKSNA